MKKNKNFVFAFKLSFLMIFLTSCGTVDYISSGFSNEEEAIENIKQAEGELAADLQDYVDSGGEVIEQEETPSLNTQLEVVEEKLPPTPTQDYDSNLLSDEEPSSLEAPILDEVKDSSKKSLAKINFTPNLLNLDDKIQYRIATISFNSGSSVVNGEGLKKIKKIMKIAKERNAKVKIVGHASTRTRDMPIAEHKLVNFLISDKRAQSVAQAFVNYKFPKENLITEAVSDAKPLFKENMPAGTQANQRTEIFLIY